MPNQKPLVLELQELASDNRVDIRDLLLKALLVAQKLGVDEFSDWLKKELEGYESSDVPGYRKISTQLRAQIAPGRIVPMVVNNQSLEELFSNVSVGQSVNEIQAMLLENTDPQSFLQINFTPDQISLILEISNADHRDFLPIRIVEKHQLQGILDTVRQTVLEWSVKLEAGGILGGDMTFSDPEKEEAPAATQLIVNNIDNFHGIMGDVQKSHINQNINSSVNRNDLESLKNFLESLGVERDDLNNLEEAIKKDPTPTKPEEFGENVAKWIGGMIVKAARGGWRIGVNVASKLITNALEKYYGLS
jgi:hypothetical protein